MRGNPRILSRRAAAPALLLALFASAFVAGCSKAPDDAAIKSGIQSKFYADPALKSTNLQVVVTKGQVMLAGEVPSQELKDRAEKMAKETVGVAGVEDRIAVVGMASAQEQPQPAPAVAEAPPTKTRRAPSRQPERAAAQPAQAPAPEPAPAPAESAPTPSAGAPPPAAPAPAAAPAGPVLSRSRRCRPGGPGASFRGHCPVARCHRPRCRPSEPAGAGRHRRWPPAGGRRSRPGAGGMDADGAAGAPVRAHPLHHVRAGRGVLADPVRRCRARRRP